MKKILSMALLLGICQAVWAAKGPTLEQRLEYLERVVQGQARSDMVLEMQRLRQEVQQLRGELELQRHELESLESRQRELYLDLDQRLSGGSPPETDPDASAPVSSPGVAPVAPVSVATPAPARPPAPGDPKREQAAYQTAFKALQQGSYAAAIQGFRGFLLDYPNGALADNAQYWLGEASYVTRDFDTAMADFSQVLELYPHSAKVPGALLKMGFIHYEQREWAKAREVLERIVREHPSSTEARLAQDRLERMRKERH